MSCSRDVTNIYLCRSFSTNVKISSLKLKTFHRECQKWMVFDCSSFQVTKEKVTTDETFSIPWQQLMKNTDKNSIQATKLQ